MPNPAIRLLALIACALVAPVGSAFAWGSTGHRIIGRLAVEVLPDDLPAFLRTAEAVEVVGELSREPDRWKDAGKAHDSDRDPAHFLNLGDDGKVLGGPSLSSLPETRAGYETALRAVGSDSWKAGYLPYSIIEGWQQLVKDLTYWRIEAAAAEHVADPAHRAWFRRDLAERQQLTLRDLGTLSHYVGDGSQPLHVSIHFNGWGPFPNPEGYTQEHIHGPFEGPFVRDHVDPSAVKADMTPYRDCACAIATWTADYLAVTDRQVAPLYTLYKQGAFANADPRAQRFVTERLAAGAAALRDLIVDAWLASASGRAGWPAVSVADVEAGRVDPYDSMYGVD
ncbi:MAG: S1/P1 Nuclease [Caulobacteraceae bacterium]|nr:S1/P1 Nuclease [Caulobacteraceae bacterium]